MNRKEIIEALKINERAFCFLSNEEQEILKKAWKANKLDWLNSDANRVRQNANLSPIMNEGRVYRIVWDYTEEDEKPEYEECEVCVGVSGLYAVSIGTQNFSYPLLPGHPRFAGVQFEGQYDKSQWHMFLRTYINKENGLLCSHQIDTDYIPAVPIRVRFKKEK